MPARSLTYLRACGISAAALFLGLAVWTGLAAVAHSIHLFGMASDLLGSSLPLLLSLVPALVQRLLRRCGYDSPELWSILAGQYLLALIGAVSVFAFSPWLFAPASGADPAKGAALLLLCALLAVGEVCGLAYSLMRPLSRRVAKPVAISGLVLSLGWLLLLGWAAAMLNMEHYIA